MALFSGPAGTVFSHVLHTGGAIAFLAGLMLYVGWARGVRAGDDHTKLYQIGAAMTYIAIVANLFGGFIRTYAPGHPSLFAILEEPWSVVMAIKHLFLFGGMFAAVYLYEVVGPRLRRNPQARGRRETVAVGAVSGAIFIATILGAVSGIIDLGGPDEPEEPTPAPVDPDGVLIGEQNYDFSGQLTSVPPIQPGQSDGGFRVPGNVRVLVATLTWSDSVATLDISLDGPAGADLGTKLTQQGSVTIRLLSPTPGDYAYTISGSNAVNVAWDLNVNLVPRDTGLNRISHTATVAPGDFFEINTDMPLHGNISWQWSVDEGIEVPFNLHTHFDGEVQYEVQLTAAAHEGHFEAHREGGHSLMWENTSDSTLSVTYVVWGDFQVDSYYPSEPT